MDCGKRIAFLTPEFVTEYQDGGGLGNYLNRMTQALLRSGHEPEVFVLSERSPARFEHDGVLVHRVSPANRHMAIRVGYKLIGMTKASRFRPLVELLSNAIGLAQAFDARDRERPFDIVQSAESQGSGLMVRRKRDRPHLVRCSAVTRTYMAADGDRSDFRRWRIRLELTMIRRAEIVYVPCELTASYFDREHGRKVHVLRPPVLIETEPATEPSVSLPGRFLLHFGQLRPRKGTLWLAEALPLAWAQEPDLTVVCAGHKTGREDRTTFLELARDHGDRLIDLGPVTKPDLYAILQRAEASILPSLVDNLPNTVIESLLFGIPVIGSDGASIDELVEPGISGDLVPIGDVKALADAMVRAWRGESSAKPGFTWDSPVAREMSPEVAVDRFLSLAGMARSRSGPPLFDYEKSVPIT